MYQSKEEQQFNQKLREEQAEKDARNRAVWQRVENGAMELSQKDVDALTPRQRIDFHRMGGIVKG